MATIITIIIGIDIATITVIVLLDPYVEQTAPRGKDNARLLRSLVLVLRYSGMRIGDVVQLTTDQIAGNKLMVYTQKTGVPVNTVLPDFVITCLEAKRGVHGEIFSGQAPAIWKL